MGKCENTLLESYEIEYNFNKSLLRNERSLDVLLEYISTRLDEHTYDYPLNESISITTQFSDFIPLLEAVDSVTEIKKDIDKFKDESDDKKKIGILKKTTNSIKSLMNWWYKIEPDKKFATLHTILKIVMSFLMLVLRSIINSKLTKSVMSTSFTKSSSTALIIPDKKLHIKLGIKGLIISIIIGIVLNPIFEFLKKLDSDAEYKINKKDLDKNIEIYDKEIDKLNSQISVCTDPDIRDSLIKARNKIELCLSKLIKMKDKYENNDKENK